MIFPGQSVEVMEYLPFRKYNRDLGILTRPHGLGDKRFGLGTNRRWCN